MNAKEIIARRVAQELKDGEVVNLGIGLPTMVTKYLPTGINVILHSENGLVGMGPTSEAVIPNLVDAGGKSCSILPGGAIFDTLLSFSLIRGGHVDVSVLGGLQVDQHGNIANWTIPGKKVPGIGGAMDLVASVKKVIVALEHCSKEGNSKILKECTLPLTGKGKVNMIVTEFGVFRTASNKLILEEIAPGITLEEVKVKTEAEFTVSPQLKLMW